MHTQEIVREIDLGLDIVGGWYDLIPYYGRIFRGVKFHERS